MPNLMFRRTGLELVVFLLVICQFINQFETVLDHVLANHFQNLALLQGLPADVQRQILEVDDALDKF
ncbi:hypothetical protein GJ496_010980 [Pomphorhynchus laevis]|nr:hypothetical protein GJ496_010980 [Pomphorhynchus laevis]